MEAIVYFAPLAVSVAVQSFWVQKEPWDWALGLLRVSTLAWAIGVPVLIYVS